MCDTDLPLPLIRALANVTHEEADAIWKWLDETPDAVSKMIEMMATIAQQGVVKRPPTIVCLCGSTKFKDAFLDVQRRETIAGRIVLSVGLFGHADGWPTADEKITLDELHLRKIDLADQVLVINPGGYVGESTTREIEYALLQRKHVRSLTLLPKKFYNFANECNALRCIREPEDA